jgi:hypothetical protein
MGEARPPDGDQPAGRGSSWALGPVGPEGRQLGLDGGEPPLSALDLPLQKLPTRLVLSGRQGELPPLAGELAREPGKFLLQGLTFRAWAGHSGNNTARARVRARRTPPGRRRWSTEGLSLDGRPLARRPAGPPGHWPLRVADDPRQYERERGRDYGPLVRLGFLPTPRPVSLRIGAALCFHQRRKGDRDGAGIGEQHMVGRG